MPDLKEVLRGWSEIMAENRERLIALDSEAGDSDLGLTMDDGFRAAYEAVKDSPESDIGKLAYFAGKAMGAAVPSTMGTLMASGLMNAGKKARGIEEYTNTFWPDFFQAYYEGVQARGKAQLGDKTFLDAFWPGVEALRDNPGDLRATARQASIAANEAFQATRGMLARHGRMAIRGEQSRAYLDPGAAVAALLIDGFYQIITRQDG